MDSNSYKSEWWQGREVLPGSSMRFAHLDSTPRITAEGLGGDLAPLFDRDKSGKLVKPRPHRAGEEDYTIGAYLSGGDKRVLGKLLDSLTKASKRK